MLKTRYTDSVWAGHVQMIVVCVGSIVNVARVQVWFSIVLRIAISSVIVSIVLLLPPTI